MGKSLACVQRTHAADRATRAGKRATSALREGMEQAMCHFNVLEELDKMQLVELGRMKAPARLRLAEKGALKGPREAPCGASENRPCGRW